MFFWCRHRNKWLSERSPSYSVGSIHTNRDVVFLLLRLNSEWVNHLEASRSTRAYAFLCPLLPRWSLFPVLAFQIMRYQSGKKRRYNCGFSSLPPLIPLLKYPSRLSSSEKEKSGMIFWCELVEARRRSWNVNVFNLNSGNQIGSWAKKRKREKKTLSESSDLHPQFNESLKPVGKV